MPNPIPEPFLRGRPPAAEGRGKPTTSPNLCGIGDNVSDQLDPITSRLCRITMYVPNKWVFLTRLGGRQDSNYAGQVGSWVRGDANALHLPRWAIGDPLLNSDRSVS